MNHAEWLAFSVALAAGAFGLVGAVLTLFLKQDSPRMLAFGLAFAGGAMVYISLTEILPKAIGYFEMAGFSERTAMGLGSVGLFAGLALVASLDRLLPNPHAGMSRAELLRSPEALKRTGLVTALAIGAHNLPEGLATFMAMLDDPRVGAPLAFAIALHNIPEGVSIAVPVFYATGSRLKAAGAAGLAAVAEPVGALIGWALFAGGVDPLAYGLIFAMIAGVMTFLGLDELLPAAKRHAVGHETVYGLALGMGAVAASLVLFA